MEILLLQDIPNVGKKNDLLVVGDGYALNCLLPLRKALVATPTVRRRYAEVIRKRAEEKMNEKAMKDSAAATLAGKEIAFARKATKTGKLYAAITEKNIVEALKDQHSIDIAEDTVEITEPIKALGTFEIAVNIAESAQKVKVKVTQEK